MLGPVDWRWCGRQSSVMRNSSKKLILSYCRKKKNIRRKTQTMLVVKIQPRRYMSRYLSIEGTKVNEFGEQWKLILNFSHVEDWHSRKVERRGILETMKTVQTMEVCSTQLEVTWHTPVQLRHCPQLWLTGLNGVDLRKSTANILRQSLVSRCFCLFNVYTYAS